MQNKKNGLPTSPVVKKAIRINLSGEQAFKAKKKEVSEEIAQLASQRLQGTVARATAVKEDEVTKTAEPVTIEPPAPEVSETQEVDKPTDIRDTTHISAEEAEAIKALASEAEDMKNIEFLKGKIAELQEELGKMTALKEKFEDDLKQTDFIKEKLDETQEELGKSFEIKEKIEADVKMFVSITDELLGDLPEEVVANFMKTDSANLYRAIVEKYKA